MNPLIRILPIVPEAQSHLPIYATTHAAGADVKAWLPEGSLTLKPRLPVAIPTGLILEIPNGFEVQVRARSGLALHHSIGLPNGPGTIDSDYRGELKILLINWGEKDYTIQHGDRIAQLVVAPVVRAEFQIAESIDLQTARGAGGFGHTGKS
jgi:dUTP pyrophosphatase